MRSLLLGAILGTATLSAQTSLSAPAAPASSAPAAVAPSDIYRSVVRVEVATQVPDYATPWNSGRFSGGIGTGFLIGKNRFLTNAHVVSNGRRILITVYGSPKKYPAKVLFVAHDSDLALLEVEDFTDFAAFPLLKINPGVPQLESQVRVIGYPVGGERLSVTRGVVSRIEFQPYSHSRADSHLVVQIDAAINPGNSGGPVVQGSDVVGVAFQGLRTADNTGYMIPSPVILRFLKDIEDGSYDLYTDLGISDFPLFNPAMRKAFGLPDNGLGVLITDVLPTSPADGLIRANDVLLAVDGSYVDSAGQVTLDGENVNMHEIIERKFAGDVVKLSVVRAGQRSEVSVKLAPVPASRLYAIQYEKKPRYVVAGGLVFQPLDTNLYASTKLENIHVRRLFSDYVSKGIFLERKDIVVLTRVESDPLTSQMDGFAGLAVDKVNGTQVRDLRHLNELLTAASPPEFFVIELFGAPRPLILPSAEIAAANQRVQRECAISNLSNLED
jgi:S1-C subfamily serine protease